MIVTEVLYESMRDADQLRPLLAVQDDETYNGIRPLILHRVGDLNTVEFESCLNGTGGCEQQFLVWQPGKIIEIGNSIRLQVDQHLPAGYRTLKAPHIDIDALSGSGGAWLKSDPNCCPSGLVTFSLEVSSSGLNVRDVKVRKNPQR